MMDVIQVVMMLNGKRDENPASILVESDAFPLVSVLAPDFEIQVLLW